jgi:hypothetical protein
MINLSLSYSDAEALIDLLLASYDADRLSDWDYLLLNIADQIEKELGIE